MRGLIVLLSALLGVVYLFGESGRPIPPAKEVDTPEGLRREFRRLSENVLSRSGGDDLFYVDVKNERIGIGTDTPQAGLDVQADGFGFPPAADIDDAITPSRAGIAYYNSTANNGEVCISTAALISAWATMGTPGTACSN